MGTGDGSQTRDGRLRHSGEWRSGEEWPLPDTEFTTYYIHGDGRLSTDEPTAEDAATSYEFDPSDPVPTLGGNCSSYITYEPRDENLIEYPLANRNLHDITGRGGFDQRTRPDTLGAESPYGPLEERNDVLVYRTEPLEEDLEITGPIRVSVFGSTDAPDTDFTAKLIDEYPPSEEFPNGFAVNLADSHLPRALPGLPGRARPARARRSLRVRDGAIPDGERLQGGPPHPAGHLLVELPALRREPQHRRAAVR